MKGIPSRPLLRHPEPWRQPGREDPPAAKPQTNRHVSSYFEIVRLASQNNLGGDRVRVSPLPRSAKAQGS